MEVMSLTCEYKEKVLNYLKNDQADSEILAHIEQCEQCSAMVEGYLEKEKELLPPIPKAEYEGSNQKLKMKIIKYNRGRGRILLFTVLGLIMGWLSFNYVRDSFFLTKLIMAIPYKISEFIYKNLHDVSGIYRTYGVPNEYFPQSMLVTFLAERVTPVLIGGAIYGSIGYFTGDKKIFTLSKYLKFASVWCCMLLVWIGIVFAGNAISVRENSQLKDIRGIFLNAEDHGDGYYKGDEMSRGDIFALLYTALGDVSRLKDLEHYKITESQTTVAIYMGFGRYSLATVNWDEKYMKLDTGRVVTIPDAFAELVKEYYEGSGHFTGEAGSYSSYSIEDSETKEVDTDETAD